jgi:hypothetical protein
MVGPKNCDHHRNYSFRLVKIKALCAFPRLEAKRRHGVGQGAFK